MQRKNFKKVDNKLAFNTPDADPQFLILQELDNGFLYVLESKPFGPVNFVYKELVNIQEDKDEETQETSETSDTNKPNKKGK